jgi:hypothetical protein
MSTMTMRCPNCGKEYGLTPEYLAQFGGQQTQCTCGAAIMVPTSAPPQMAPMPPAAYPAAPAQGVIPYATPVQYQQNMLAPQGAWRDGNQLVCWKEVALPSHCCVKCDQPADAPPLNKKFVWHSPWVYVLLLVTGPLIYVLVALCVQQKARAVIPLCRRHRGRRSALIWMGWGLFLGSIGLFAAAINASSGMLAIGGVVAILAAAILSVYTAASILTPAKIDGQYAWYRGASQAYLSGLGAIYRQ